MNEKALREEFEEFAKAVEKFHLKIKGKFKNNNNTIDLESLRAEYIANCSLCLKNFSAEVPDANYCGCKER